MIAMSTFTVCDGCGARMRDDDRFTIHTAPGGPFAPGLAVYDVCRGCLRRVLPRVAPGPVGTSN